MIEIDGEEYEIYPAVWEVFEQWWGDKAYRHAEFVEEFQQAVIDVHAWSNG